MRRQYNSIQKAGQKYNARSLPARLSKRRPIGLLTFIALALTFVFVTGAGAQRQAVAGFPAPNIRAASAVAATVFVYPRFDCVDYDPATGSAVAYFGYTNLGRDAVTISRGINNEFIQDPSFRNQPTTFAPGTYYKVFSTDFDVSVGLNWVLNGTFATATTDLAVRCKDAPGTPSSTAFTYQGRLTDGAAPANGTYDLQFKLYDALSDGNLTGSPDTVTLNNPGVQVTNGIFSVLLDFGTSGFSGANRYLDIAVRSHSSDPNTPAYTTLLPRQQLTSAPYAIRSNMATTADNVSGLIATGNGGTGLDAAPTASGQYLRSSAAGTWSISPLTSDDIPALDAAKIASGVLPIARGGTGTNLQSFVDLSTDQTIGGNKTFSGALSGNGSGLSNVSGTFHWQTVTGTGTSQQAQPNNGYVVTNAGQVTVTLPVATNVGDTVRVSGLGAGGWKIVQNAGQSVLGANLSLIGATWTSHESLRNWQAVAVSVDGTKLVAVVTNGQIYTSTDSGVSWTPRESIRTWQSVASSADGVKLVAVASGDQIYTSTDSGVSWTSRESARVWHGVASSADGVKLVAVANLGQIYTSTDSGMTWTPRENSRQWWCVASSADGNKLIAGEYQGQLYISNDGGANWTPRASSAIWWSIASSTDGNKLAAVVNGGQIYTSADGGVSWTAHESNRFWNSIASSADGNKLVAVVGGGLIYTSSDAGVSWTPRESSRNWHSVASTDDGGKLIAVASNGLIYTSHPQSLSATTTNGTAGYLLGGQSTAIELQYIGNGQFLPLSYVGTIFGY